MTNSVKSALYTFYATWHAPIGQGGFEIQDLDHSYLLRPFLMENERIEEALAKHCKNGARLLHAAALLGQLATVEPLLSAGGVLDQDGHGRTALIAAAMSRSTSKSHLAILRMLWEGSGAEGRALQDGRGRSVLHWLALRMRGQQALRVVLDHMDDITAESIAVADLEGNTVLHCLASLSSARSIGTACTDPGTESVVAVVSALLEKVPAEALSARNGSGFTPLHLAARKSNRLVLRLMVERATAEQMLMLDNEGRSFLSHVCESHPERTVWEIVPLLPEEVLTKIPDAEVALTWPTRCFPVSLLTIVPVASAEKMLDRVPQAMLDSVEWVTSLMVRAVGDQRFGFLLKLLEVTDMEKRLKEKTWHDAYFSYRCNNLVALFGHMDCRLSEEQADIVEQILRKYPESFFLRNKPPLVSAAAKSNCPRILGVIAELTKVSDLEWTWQVYIARTGKAANLLIIVSHLPGEQRTGSLFMRLLTSPRLDPHTWEQILPYFDDEAVLFQGAEDGKTALHHVAQASGRHREFMMKLLIARAPALRSLRDHEGKTPLEAVQAMLSPYSKPDPSNDILMPMVKSAHE